MTLTTDNNIGPFTCGKQNGKNTKYNTFKSLHRIMENFNYVVKNRCKCASYHLSSTFLLKKFMFFEHCRNIQMYVVGCMLRYGGLYHERWLEIFTFVQIMWRWINIKSIRLNTFFIQAKNCLLLHVRFCWVKHIQVLFVFSKFWWIQIECLPIWQFSIIAHSVQRRYWEDIWPQT